MGCFAYTGVVPKMPVAPAVSTPRRDSGRIERHASGSDSKTGTGASIPRKASVKGSPPGISSPHTAVTGAPSPSPSLQPSQPPAAGSIAALLRQHGMQGGEHSGGYQDALGLLDPEDEGDLSGSGKRVGSVVKIQALLHENARLLQVTLSYMMLCCWVLCAGEVTACCACVVAVTQLLQAAEARAFSAEAAALKAQQIAHMLGSQPGLHDSPARPAVRGVAGLPRVDTGVDAKGDGRRRSPSPARSPDASARALVPKAVTFNTLDDRAFVEDVNNHAELIFNELEFVSRAILDEFDP